MGYRVAAMEIEAGTASFAQARERGLFPKDPDARIAWDSGYDDCVCAHRLGHSVEAMVGFELFAPALVSTPALVAALLDGRWEHKTRPDPRR